MHPLLKLFSVSMLFLVLLSYSRPASADSVRIMVVSDIHYLSPSCYEESTGLFLASIKRGDGKMTQYSKELLQALLNETRHQHPDGLLVTGDLSFLGEYASHLDLAAAFMELQNEGIPVWVIPGNHDINSDSARAFTGSSWQQVSNPDPAAFYAIYAPFLGNVNSFGANMSFVVQLSDKLQLALCDASIYEPEPVPAGYYSANHQSWLQDVLERASASECQVITATNQSLIPHTSFLEDSMTVKRGGQMVQDMINSGICRLNLSGHLHLQHISEDSGLYDIATGSFSVPPFRFGMLSIRDDGSIIYEAKDLCDEHLPEEVRLAAGNWFEDLFISKQFADLDGTGLSFSEKTAVLSLAARMNHAYFRGDLLNEDHNWSSDPAWALFLQLSDGNSYTSFLVKQLTAPENRLNALKLELPPL